MPTPYCEKHEWPAGMDKPCPDCAEMAVLQAKIESLDLQVGELKAALGKIVGEAANADEMVLVAVKALGENWERDVAEKQEGAPVIAIHGGHMPLSVEKQEGAPRRVEGCPWCTGQVIVGIPCPEHGR
jgi:hypothetical protein